jgi:hypothetical protein
MAASSESDARKRVTRSSKNRERKQEQQNVSTKAPDSPSRFFGLELETAQALLQLALVFAAWKTLLLIIAYASPGPGYDTSSQLLPFFEQSHVIQDNTASWSTLQSLIRRLALHLTRWDAVYFTSAADRGHVFEQEWAFSPFLATLTSTLTRRASSSFSYYYHLILIEVKSIFDLRMLIRSSFCSDHHHRELILEPRCLQWCA